jgi:hypothetical protein
MQSLKAPAQVIHPEMRAKQIDREEKTVVEIILKYDKLSRAKRSVIASRFYLIENVYVG